MSITIGWWAIPALITLAALIWAFWPQDRHSFGSAVVGAIQLMAACIVSLISWLVWSLAA